MSNGLEKRLSRLEQLVEERSRPRVCNCRMQTIYHNAGCLAAILKIMPRVCPLHGFRQLGFFLWRPLQFPLVPEDNQYCPCPTDFRRTLLIIRSRIPYGWERYFAALVACHERFGNQRNSDEDANRANAVLQKYRVARQRWLDKTGRTLPSGGEIMELLSKQVRKMIDEARVPIR
jgi:hypothetical protein